MKSHVFSSGRHPYRVPNCSELSAFYAKDNKATFGHVCTGHLKEMPLHERENYVHDAQIIKAYQGDT